MTRLVFLDTGEIYEADDHGEADTSKLVAAIVDQDDDETGNLLASAPQMKEALEAAEEFIASIDPESFTLAEVREALKAARGE